MSLPTSVIEAGLAEAFRMGADKGAKEVVALQDKYAALLAERDRLREAVRRLNDAIRIWGQTGRTDHLTEAVEPEGP